jgi:hypothetical protein
MPCWVCKAAILAAVIALLVLLAQVAAVSAAVINAIQAIILAAGTIGLELSPIMLTGCLGLIAGFSVTQLAEWLCCKMGVTRCCDES